MVVTIAAPHPKCYIGSMDRTRTKLFRKGEEPEDNFVPGTAEERFEILCDLIEQVASLNPKYDVKQQLQRNVTRLIRRKG